MEEETTSPVREGDTLAGKYRIERVLGVGGMGVVVAALHMQLDQRVAIKFLLPEAMANAEVVSRFAREARAAAKIQSEHVARVIDVGTLETGSPYMVMEYLEGNDLHAVLENDGALPLETAVSYVLQACEAIAEAHAAGIVHRDLKPSNLFLAKRSDRPAIIKVLDFGISKTKESQGDGALTKTSAMMGSPYYMSPEQMKATKGVDARSDIWSLGVILYELVSNARPYGGETMAEIIGTILGDDHKPVRDVASHLPVAYEAVVEKCLKKKAADRYQNIAELVAALAPFGPETQQRLTVERVHRVLGAEVQRASGEQTGAAQVVPMSSPQTPALTTSQAPEAVAKTVGTWSNTASGAAAAPPAEKPRSRALLIGGGVALAGVAGLVVALTLGGKSGATPTGATHEPPATTTAAETAKPATTSALTAAGNSTEAPQAATSAPIVDSAKPATPASATKTIPTATTRPLPGTTTPATPPPATTAATPPATTTAPAPTNPLEAKIK